MAETTITGLPNATVPLSGTERVPMDQNGITADASTQSIANLAQTAITAAVTAHEAAADPHVQYLTATEGNAAYATAAQGALAVTAIQPGDAALSNSREWTAETITQAEAEAGTATTRRAFTAQRVFQAAAAWWQGYSSVVGRSVVTAADASAARTAIGAGTSSVAISATAAQSLGASAAAGATGQAADAGHVHQRDTDVIVIPVGDESTALTTGTNRMRFRMPFAATLLAVRANVNSAPTGSTLIVDINEGGTSILGTKLSIDATEFSSTTAASAATITDSALADDAEISIDIDQIGSTIAGAGLKVSLFVRRT